MPARVNRQRSLAAALAIAFSIVVAALVAWRLRYGVDFIDEAFYVAIPFRFASGARPFVDEMAVQQSAQMLLVPFIKAYLMVRGDATGIVLAVRALWLVLMSGCALASYAVLSRIASKAVAILASLSLVTFIPFLIPSVSYNTMGAAFLALALYLGVLAFVFDRGSWPAIGSGVFFGLAALAYPTFVIAGSAFLVALCGLEGWTGVRASKALRPWLIAYAAVGVGLMVLLLSFGVENLLTAYRFTSGSSVGGGSSKLISLGAQTGGLFTAAWPAVVLLAVALIMGRRWPLARLLVLGTPFFVFRATGYGYLANVGPILFVCAAYAVLLFGPPLEATAKRAAWLVVLPATACGAIASYTSTNGYNNAFVGLLAAVPLSIALLACVAAAIPDRPVLGLWASVVFSAIVVATAVYAVFQGCYSDPRPSSLHAAIASGPYAGMITTDQKAESWASLEREVGRLGLARRGVVFFDSFPAGYLLLPSARAINSVWSGTAPTVGTVVQDTAGVNYFKRQGIQPDAGVRILRFDAKERVYAAGHPLSAYFASQAYESAFSSPRFQIWIRPDTR